VQFAQAAGGFELSDFRSEIDKNSQKQLKKYGRFEPFVHKIKNRLIVPKNMHKFKKTYSQTQYLVV